MSLQSEISNLRSEIPDNSALVLLAHGSTRNAGSAVPAYLHGDELRRRALFAEVTEAFWLQEPSIAGVLRSVFAPRVFFVPLFIGEGWFTDHVIPAELGFRLPGAPAFERVQVRGSQTLFYCAPVGSHPAMTGVLEARARGIVTQHPFPRAPRPSETALFIAGHGTAYSPGSCRAIEHQVTRIGESGEYAEVHAVFLEEEPRVSDCWRRTAARNIVMVPFFISDGLHTVEDIPVMLGETESVVRERLQAGHPPWRNPTERHGKRLWLAGAVGTEPLLADVILERVREAAAWQPTGQLAH